MKIYPLSLLCCLFIGACSLGPRTPTRPESATTIIAAGEEVAQISRDNNGVPHIIAADDKKLMAAWGYVHATDRM